MAGLVDLVPARSSVTIGDQAVSVQGVSARVLAEIMADHPALRALLDQREVTVDEVVGMALDAVPRILAAGTGAPHDEAAIAAADALPLAEQVDLLTPILELTMPKVVRPLVAALVGKLTDAAQSLTAPDSTSPKDSSD